MTHARALRWRVFACAKIFGTALVLMMAAPALSAVSEAEIKAAYLYKLASFVRWPDSAFVEPAAPLRICIAGRPDVYHVVDGLTRGQDAAGRHLSAESVNPARPDTVAHCQILYLGEGETAVPAMLAQIAQAPVLTVTDRAGGTHGGIIEFVLVGGNIRFTIHRQSSEVHQLVLSSKLLAVAVSVEP